MSESRRLAGVTGWPVAGSLSPAIHTAAYRALGIPWTYAAIPVLPGRLADALDDLAPLGLAGLSVTIPHKDDAARLATTRSDVVERLGAANTLLISNGDRVAENTDVEGFRRFLLRDAGFAPAGIRAMIAGAGGAARACALALAQEGVASLVVAVRDPSRAGPLRSALDGSGTEVEVVTLGDAASLTPGMDLVVNATPVGGAGDRLPLGPFSRRQVVIDLRYRPHPTPLLEEARAAGAATFGGLGMLLRQAALQVELFTGRTPPFEVLESAARHRLA